jgi:hypothetical protein
VTVYSVMEQRVVAWCEGHTSWVTTVCFDPWYVQVTCSFLVMAVLSLAMLQDLILPQCLHVWVVQVMVALQAGSCASCTSLHMSRNAQGHAAKARPGTGQVNKQHRNGGRQQQHSICTCTGRGSVSSRHHIPCGLACAGLPHLYVGPHYPTLALASAPRQVRAPPRTCCMSLPSASSHCSRAPSEQCLRKGSCVAGIVCACLISLGSLKCDAFLQGA